MNVMYRVDWFHSLIDLKTYKCIVVFITMYVLMVMMFSLPFLYIGVRCDCNLDVHSYLDAIYFTLEAVSTTNYMSHDKTFNKCFVMLFFLMCMSICKLCLDGLTIGITFCRISRPTTRALTCIFSDKAIIKRNQANGQMSFVFKVCELRKHQCRDIRLRLYCMKRKKENKNVTISTQDMKILDEHLLLFLPELIVHVIDTNSPLYPPQSSQYKLSRSLRCDYERVKELIFTHMMNTNMEILAILEGTDPISGLLVQARHSYICSDIVVDGEFACCVHEDDEDGYLEVDFNRFHEITFS